MRVEVMMNKWLGRLAATKLRSSEKYEFSTRVWSILKLG